MYIRVGSWLLITVSMSCSAINQATVLSEQSDPLVTEISNYCPLSSNNNIIPIPAKSSQNSTRNLPTGHPLSMTLFVPFLARCSQQPPRKTSRVLDQIHTTRINDMTLFDHWICILAGAAFDTNLSFARQFYRLETYATRIAVPAARMISHPLA